MTNTLDKFLKELKSEYEPGGDEYKAYIMKLPKWLIVKLLMEVQKERDDLEGASDSWSLKDILKKLIEASDILLDKKDYDGHDWEEISLARKLAKTKLLKQ